MEIKLLRIELLRFALPLLAGITFTVEKCPFQISYTEFQKSSMLNTDIAIPEYNMSSYGGVGPTFRLHALTLSTSTHWHDAEFIFELVTASTVQYLTLQSNSKTLQLPPPCVI